MAGVAATMQWEIDAATGNALNGGGFDDTSGTPGTNYAWGAGQATFAYTDLASTSASSWLVLTSANRPFVDADVGNVIAIASGTNFAADRYQILSVAGGAATINKACGSVGNAADGVAVLGGALAGIVAAFFQVATTPMTAGNKVWLRYNASASAMPSAITAGVAGTAVLPVLFSGYYATHGDDPTIVSGHQPTISCAAYNFAFGAYWRPTRISFASAVADTTYAITATGTGVILSHCKLTSSSTGRGINLSGNAILDCEVSGVAGFIGIALSTGRVQNCYFHDCAADSVVSAANTGSVILDNVFDTCKLAITLGTSSLGAVQGNTIVNCATGISASTANCYVVQNNAISQCGIGIIWTTQTDSNLFRNNNIYGCTTPTSGIAATGTWTPIGGTTADPEFVTTIATGTTATTNGAPGTTFTATGLLAGVSTSDYLCVWSGTGATAGVYAIASVAGAPDSITLATSPGISASAIKWGIVKGGTTTDLSLAPTSDCIGAGYGLAAGLGVASASQPSQGAWESGATGGYTYGDADAAKVLTTATGAGTYQAVAASNVVDGVSVGVSPTVGTYPTTAASQAAQLATDQAAVLAAAESIDGGTIILGQEGTGVNLQDVSDLLDAKIPTLYEYGVSCLDHSGDATPADEWLVIPRKNYTELATGSLTSPTLTVTDAAGNVLLNGVTLVEVGTSGKFAYTATGASRMVAGKQYTATVSATIDAAVRTGPGITFKRDW